MARDLSSDDVLKQQKARALRIDHNYHAKPHPWRQWMRMMSFAVPLVTAGIIAILQFIPPRTIAGIGTGENIFTPGPVSTKHALFADRCDKCHDMNGTLFGAVTDAKCLACHDGPLHNSRQTYHGENLAHGFIDKVTEKDGEVYLEKVAVKAPSPRCANCHNEHRGSERLAEISDHHCTQCHLDLKVNDKGSLKYQSGIKSFAVGHPEWAALRQGKDATPLKFNHAVHMGPTSTVKTANGEKLDCAACHKPDAQRAYMAPINYEMHCQSCHAINIPPVPGIGNVLVPHDKPEIVRKVVKSAFLDFQMQGGKPPTVKTPNPKFPKLRPGQPKPKDIPEFIETPDPRPVDQWLKESIDAAVEPIFFPKVSNQSACNYCHEIGGKDEALNIPKVIDPKVPSIWLKHSKFNHESHRVVSCKECHGMAEGSKLTSDVLLPGIASCQQCHHPGGARDGCNECHVYHDKKHVNFNGKIGIKELLENVK